MNKLVNDIRHIDYAANRRKNTTTDPRRTTHAQTVEKGIDRNDSQKSALGPRANAMTASSVSSS